MWEPDLSPKTPIVYQQLLSDGYFTFSPSSNSLSRPQQLLTEEGITPLSSKEKNYVIIPLHSPPKKLMNLGHDSAGRSSVLSNCSTPVISRDNGTQPHRRSPEKRLLSSPGPICRICHEGDKEEALLSPCNCSGSMLLVHKTCLEKWLSTSSTDHCELCMKKLPVRKECRPIWQWFSMNTSSHGPQGFYADLTCVVLLTPLCLLSIYLCAVGAADYMKHGVWEGTGLAALSLFLLGTYVIWCYITVKFHWVTLQKWRISNQVIQLVEKECRRRDELSQRISDSVTPRNTLVLSRGWESPPDVYVFSPVSQVTLPPQTVGSVSGNHPNVMDASIRGIDVPAFL